MQFLEYILAIRLNPFHMLGLAIGMFIYTYMYYKTKRKLQALQDKAVFTNVMSPHCIDMEDAFVQHYYNYLDHVMSLIGISVFIGRAAQAQMKMAKHSSMDAEDMKPCLKAAYDDISHYIYEIDTPDTPTYVLLDFETFVRQGTEWTLTPKSKRNTNY